MKTINKQLISKVIPVSGFLMAIYSILAFFKPGVPMVSLLNNTTLWWVISTLILVAFFLSSFFFYDKRNADNLLIVWLYLLWNGVCIVRGIFEAEMYWDWKALIGNTMALMLPVVIFSATNKSIVQSLLAFYIKYGLPLFLLFVFIIYTSAFGFYLNPVSFLLLFLPTMSKRQKILIICLTIIVLLVDLGARSNVIKFGVPFGILIIYYFRNFISIKLLEYLRILLFIIPLFFFILGVSGIFNVLNMSDYIKNDVTAMGVDQDGNRVEQSIIVDTRTFIYKEVLESAVDNNYWLLGRTPTRGNDSEVFAMFGEDLTGRYERISNEIGLANVFTWTGVVGVILYFIIFYRASFLAINRSRNIYVKMLGVYIAFRWLYSWIEDVNNFSINYFMLMVMIGLCFSNYFRNMSDKEVLVWSRGIFDARYLRLQQYLLKNGKYEKKEFGSFVDLSQQEK